MGCGYKSIFLVVLIVVDVVALAGTILNLVWMEADIEQRTWLGWVLLATDGLAVVLSVLVGIFHWTRLRYKALGGLKGKSQMNTFHVIDVENDAGFADNTKGNLGGGGGSGGKNGAVSNNRDVDSWAETDDFE